MFLFLSEKINQQSLNLTLDICGTLTQVSTKALMKTIFFTL